MISKLYYTQLFSKLFTLGLLLLFAGIFEEQLISAGKANFLFFDSIVFFSIGATLCLVSFLFLLIEWVILPFGTQTKRIKLYQGIGNLLAFAMLMGGWLSKEEASPNIVNSLSFSFSSGGLLVAVIFGWLGSNIANYISRKKINLEAARDRIRFSESRLPGSFINQEAKSSGKVIASSRIPVVQN